METTLPNLSEPKSLDAKDQEIPAEAQATIDAWQGFKAAADEYWNKFHLLNEAERKSKGFGDDFADSKLVMCRYDCAIDTEKIAQRALRLLVYTAEREFSPAGASLSIAIPDKDNVPGASPENFDPRAVWEYLARTYGGEVGSQTAYRQTAKILGEDLRLRVGMEPRMIGGRVVFDLSIYPDPYFGHPLGSRSQAIINRVLDGFLAVAEWSGRWGLVERQEVRDMQRLVSDLSGRMKNQVNLRDRRFIGSDVLIVPFKSKWEFRIAPEFAEKFQIFMTEFDGLLPPKTW
jgi:hypothetical protein